MSDEPIMIGYQGAKRVYICGRMRGLPYYNFAAFDESRDALKRKGFDVVSPADLDRAAGFDPRRDCMPSHDWNSIPKGFDLSACVKRDLDALQTCDLIAVLPDGENGVGGHAELSVAKWLKLPRIHHLTGEPWVETGEVRTKDPVTGGEKGAKLARFDLLPAGPLWQLAEHYGRGAKKYQDHNWRRGYKWSLNFAAMMRHAWAWWRGESIDAETGSSHMVAVAWHAFSLIEFETEKIGTDDRWKPK